MPSTKGLTDMLDRSFDMCEALSCLAHDWGLYSLNSRLDKAEFSPRRGLNSDNLEPEAQEMYDNGNEWLSQNNSDPYDPRPIPAGVLRDGHEIA